MNDKRKLAVRADGRRRAGRKYSQEESACSPNRVLSSGVFYVLSPEM